MTLSPEREQEIRGLIEAEPSGYFTQKAWRTACSDLLAALDSVRAELAAVRETLQEFEHVAGEPVSETAAVAVSAYGFAQHGRKVAEAELAAREPWDESPGDVIHAYRDGAIVLDDAITTFHPLRALAWFADEVERLRSELAAHRGRRQ